MAVAEFSIYPFVTERLEPYVSAALEETRKSGLSVEVGPLGTTVRGELDQILQLLERILLVAFAHGARKIVASVESDEPPEPASL